MRFKEKDEIVDVNGKKLNISFTTNFLNKINEKIKFELRNSDKKLKI